MTRATMIRTALAARPCQARGLRPARLLLFAATLGLQTACAAMEATPPMRAPVSEATAPALRSPLAAATSGREGAMRAPTPSQFDAMPVWGQRFYLDDGPGDRPSAELDRIPDAVPAAEPLRAASNQPYTVFGRTYAPIPPASGFRQTGIASWYGKRFHGKPTSSGETYDMYAMSAAHPTLPIPSYARVTHQASGRSVVVRINDRGPFHPGRVMDLSYAAAHRLGFAAQGSAEVMVEALLPGTAPQGDGDEPMLASTSPAPGQTAGTRGPVRAERSAARSGALAPSAAGGLWLQLGAFNSRENAESLRRAVGKRLPELLPDLSVLDIEGRWRLRLGPLQDRESLDALRDTVRDALGIKALPVRP